MGYGGEEGGRAGGGDGGLASGWYERVDLICGVSADHVLDGFVTARVIFHPSVNLEDMLILDDDSLSIRDESLDLPLDHDGVSPRHVEGW